MVRARNLIVSGESPSHIFATDLHEFVFRETMGISQQNAMLNTNNFSITLPVTSDALRIMHDQVNVSEEQAGSCNG
jgi:hypothetical protein